MKKQIASCFLLVSLSSFSQVLTKYTDNLGKIGFINSLNDTVVKAQFDYVQHNYFGHKALPYCIVGKQNKYGVLDKTGKLMLDLNYDEIAQTWGNDLLAVKSRGKYGIFSLKTKHVEIPEKYTYAPQFVHDVATIHENGKYGLLGANLKPILPPTYDSISPVSKKMILFGQSGKFGYMNLKGEVIIPAIYDKIDNDRYQIEERIRVKIGEKWGIIDPKGNKITELIYDEIQPYSFDLAGFYRNGKGGYLDRSGKEVIPAQYAMVDWFVKDIAFVGKTNPADSLMYYGVINKSGGIVYPFEFDEFEMGYPEDVFLVTKNGKTGAINWEGKMIVPMEYTKEDIIYDFEVDATNYIILRKNGNVKMIDTKGTEILPEIYDKIDYADHSNDSYICIFRNGKKGWFDLQKMKEIVPVNYDQVVVFELEGGKYVQIKNGENYGIWDIEWQKEVVPTRFDAIEQSEVYNSKSTYFITVKNATYGLWDATNGIEIIPPMYQYVQPVEELTATKAPYFFGVMDDKWSLYDSKGKQIIPMLYSELPNLLFDGSQKYLVVFSSQNQRYGLFDFNGKQLLPFEFLEINYIKNGKVHATKEETQETIDLKKLIEPKH